MILVLGASGQVGRALRDVLPDAVAKSRDRLCTVSRTVALETPLEFTLTDGRTVE